MKSYQEINSYLRQNSWRDLQLPGTNKHCEFLSRTISFKHHKFNARQAQETQLKRDLGSQQKESQRSSIFHLGLVRVVDTCTKNPSCFTTTRKRNCLKIKLIYIISQKHLVSASPKTAAMSMKWECDFPWNYTLLQKPGQIPNSFLGSHDFRSAQMMNHRLRTVSPIYFVT